MKIIFTLIFLLSPTMLKACEPQMNVQYQKIAHQPRIIFGELQGTNESPAFFESIACLASRMHSSVTMAIEWPSDIQGDIERYLANSKRRQSDLGHALDFFSYSKDGRSSKAMLHALTSLASQIETDKIHLVLMDKPISVMPVSRFKGLTRDKYMWEKLSEAVTERPTQQTIVLVGNYHSFRTKNSDGTPRFGQLARGFIILNMVDAGGTSWICSDFCGAHDFKESATGAAGSISLHYPNRLVDGTYQVGHISYSPPISP